MHEEGAMDEPIRYFCHQAKGTSLPCFSERGMSSYDPLTSSWLAHCAILAYEAKQTIATTLASNGFAQVTFFDQSSTQGYFAVHPGDEGPNKCGPFGVVAFRGTENDYKDILADATILKRSIRRWRGTERFRVHGGFLTALQHVLGTQAPHVQGIEVKWEGLPGLRNVLREHVQQCQNCQQGPPQEASSVDQRCAIYFTGHSLGGALAALAAYKCAGIHGLRLGALYTYGQPRVASREFATHLQANMPLQTFRVVNAADIVPRVPLWLMGFKHFGQYVYLTRNSGVVTDASPMTAIRDVWLRYAAGIVCFGLVGAGLGSFGDNLSGGSLIGLAAGTTILVGHRLPVVMRFMPVRYGKLLKRVFADHAGKEYLRKLDP